MADLIPPLPQDFVHQIKQDFPQEATTLLAALDNTEPVVSLRHNSRKCARYKASPSLAYPSTPIPWCQEGYRLEGRPFLARRHVLCTRGCLYGSRPACASTP